MNAEQIARDYRLNGASFTKLRLIRAADDMAQAVLDAAEYRKRAEAVANEMNDWCEQSDALGYPADTRGYRLWAQQLLDYSKIGCKI